MHDSSSPDSTTFTLNRRSFLRYVGAAATSGMVLVRPGRAGAVNAGAPGSTEAGGSWTAWASVAYPVPLPGDAGTAADDGRRLASFDVRDDLLLPDGFRYDVLAEWGQTFGPENHPQQQIHFGYNCDYTGLVPVDGAPGEFWLLVNHEYISARPWLQGFAAVHGAQSPVDADGKLAALLPVHGMALNLLDEHFVKAAPPELIAAARRLCEAAMGELGVSVLRVRRTDADGISVIADSPDHFRIGGASLQNVPPGLMRFTGPAAALLGTPRGTFANCSGATTPWGTFLTCEENFQDQVPEFITPDGHPLPGGVKRLAGLGGESPTKLPFEFEGLGTGLTPPLDGRQYGWVCEVNPVGRTLKKHTALGRFRHENVALRCEPGKPLAAYMGDDRRGGHVWKFVSKGVVNDPADKANTQLLEEGTLYVARLKEDFSGEWVPLEPLTRTVMPELAHLTTRHQWMPRRPAGGHVAVGHDKAVEQGEQTFEQWLSDTNRWILSAPDMDGRGGVSQPFGEGVLGDLVRNVAAGAKLMRASERKAVLLTDAYVMANCVGGTPCARPEDIEIHPHDASVYIAFTDSTGSGEGSPDQRIFPDSAGKNSRQYGAIYRLVEDGNDPAARTFTWGKFVSSGEVADGGGGFACADNLAFDPAGNLWMVCDITTPAHNFAVTRDPADVAAPGEKNFPGVFGNNALFMIPTAGPAAGVPSCFAVGPCECELTGPTFTADGRTLLLAVQHPGELHGARGVAAGAATEDRRVMKLAARDGTLFEQRRTVPLGSNFPSNAVGAVPRPCVVAITYGGTKRD